MHAACLRSRNCKHVFTSPSCSKTWDSESTICGFLSCVLRWAWVQELTSTLWSISDGPQARSGTGGPSSQALQCRVPLAPWQIHPSDPNHKMTSCRRICTRSQLAKQEYLTPNEKFFVRNHLPVPTGAACWRDVCLHGSRWEENPGNML